MDPVRKAIWFVESHSRQPITLEAIARECHVSSFHLTRAFAATAGMSLMRYVRGRRLSDAAQRLAEGADDILTVALQAGYGSHEAFSRAFRDQFDMTPQQVRARGHLKDIQLVETIPMNSTPATELTPPRIETRGPLLIAGIVERYPCQAPVGIPDQWQRFHPYLGNIPGQLGEAAYGVCYNFDRESNFDYLSGVEVKDSEQQPSGFCSLRVPEQLYAIFSHPGHVAGIRGTFSAIWSQWFPHSGYEAVEAPTIEYYGVQFNPTTGLGGLEIWIAIKE